VKNLLYAVALFLVVLGALVILENTSPRRGAIPAFHGDTILSRDIPSLPGQSTRPGSGTDRTNLSAGSENATARADTLLTLWHPREAVVLLDDALERDSTSVNARVLLIEALASPLVSDEDNVRRLCDEADALVSTPADSLFLVGVRALFVDRNPAAAVAALTGAERYGARAPGLLRYLVRADFEARRLSDARALITRIRHNDPDNAAALRLAVRADVLTGDIARAARSARDLGRAWDNEPISYVLMAQVELRRGRNDDAARFLRTALELDPRYIPAIVAQGNVFMAQDKLEAARTSYEKLLLFDDPVLRSIGFDGLASVEFLAGAFDQAVSAMDNSVREAMLAGSVRLGLRHAMRLVGYLCALGQGDAARGVIDRWVSGFGEIPEAIGRLRIDVLDGRLERVGRTLHRIESDTDWSGWAQTLGLDTIELSALARIGRSDYERASALLNTDDQSARAVTDSAAPARREFLRGYAAFEAGRAELAGAAFDSTRSLFFSTTFPYRADPVLHVQSLFYEGECALAAGRTTRARSAYSAFVRRWESSPWPIAALERAMRKLDSLQGNSVSGPHPRPGDEGKDGSRDSGSTTQPPDHATMRPDSTK